MIQINVEIHQTTYPILIENGIRHRVGTLIRERIQTATDTAVITNPTVGPIYLASVSQSLSQANFSSATTEIPDGEQFKTLDTMKLLYDGFLDAGLDRKGVVLALGGGVVGDMTGFAAATYLRGIRFVQVPTTLLAMVDASVGGKTGVDLPQGKNLVGAFCQPEMVLIDPEVLSTLQEEELTSGMAEVIKHGLIGNPTLFSRLETGKPKDFGALVDEAVRVKVDVVQRDPLEKGERALLNLGHTFGHAFELISNYQIRHGHAVGAGLVAAAKLSAVLGLCDATLVDRVRRALTTQGLTTRFSGYACEAVIDAMRHDKKRAKSKLRFAIPKKPGECIMLDDPPLDAVRAAVFEVI